MENPSTPLEWFLTWFPMLLLIGVWLLFMKKSTGSGSHQQKVLDEYRRNNELMLKVIERMDQRISRLEDQDHRRG